MTGTCCLHEDRYECCGWNDELSVNADQETQRADCVVQSGHDQWCYDATTAALGDVYIAFGALGCVAIILQSLCLSAAVQVLAAQHGVDEEKGQQIKTGHAGATNTDGDKHLEMAHYAAEDMDFM